MSREVPGQVECPKCHRENKITIHQSINTMISRELIPKLVSGELTIKQCECGHKLLLVYPILVNTMIGFNESLMIQFAPGGKEKAIEEYKRATAFTSLLGGLAGKVTFEAYEDWDEFISRVKEVERLEV